MGGHYDKTKTVGENIKISPALLSRFDLTFILLDNPDEVTSFLSFVRIRWSVLKISKNFKFKFKFKFLKLKSKSKFYLLKSLHKHKQLIFMCLCIRNLCLSVCLCVTVYFLNTIGHCFMNSDEKLLDVELIASQ